MWIPWMCGSHCRGYWHEGVCWLQEAISSIHLRPSCNEGEGAHPLTSPMRPAGSEPILLSRAIYCGAKRNNTIIDIQTIVVFRTTLISQRLSWHAAQRLSYHHTKYSTLIITKSIQRLSSHKWTSAWHDNMHSALIITQNAQRWVLGVMISAGWFVWW